MNRLGTNGARNWRRLLCQSPGEQRSPSRSLVSENRIHAYFLTKVKATQFELSTFVISPCNRSGQVEECFDCLMQIGIFVTRHLSQQNAPEVYSKVIECKHVRNQ